jgi:hypothetical protein
MHVTFRASKTGNIPWLGTDVEDDRFFEPRNLTSKIELLIYRTETAADHQMCSFIVDFLLYSMETKRRRFIKAHKEQKIW